MRDTRSRVLEIPKIAKGLQDRGGCIGVRLSGDRISAKVLKVALGGVGRDDPGRQASS